MKIFHVFLLIAISCTPVDASWTKKLSEVWDQTKKVGEKTLDSASGLCFWCDESIAGTKENFKSSIEKYDDQQLVVKDDFSNGKELLFNFASILQDAEDRDEAFASVQDEWHQVGSEIDHLNYRFKKLVKSADELFSELSRRADTISDYELRQKSVYRIEENKERYIAKLKNTKDSILTLAAANEKVKDMLTALEITYTLDTLEGQVRTTFSEIDETISSVMASLADLSVESKALLESL